MNHESTNIMVKDNQMSGISEEPVNILFNPSVVSKKDVWDIDLIEILNILIKILEQAGKKDLRIAGMAALSSALIYRMKVKAFLPYKNLLWRKNR